jgi:predicted nucleic acid-binding protein
VQGSRRRGETWTFFTTVDRGFPVILPDANLLVAFTWENHQHNAVAENFFQKYPKVATCPLTELALVRVWMQKGASGADADRALKDFVSKYRSRLIS